MLVQPRFVNSQADVLQSIFEAARAFASRLSTRLRVRTHAIVALDAETYMHAWRNKDSFVIAHLESVSRHTRLGIRH